MLSFQSSPEAIAAFRDRLMGAFQRRSLITGSVLQLYGVEQASELRNVDLARLYHRQER